MSPTDAVGGTVRLDYRPEGELSSVQVSANVKRGTWLQTSGGWSRRRYVFSVLEPERTQPSNFVSSRTAVTFGRSHVGGAYQVDLNLADSALVQQRVGVFYNAQCCGVALDYQRFTIAATDELPARPDRRFTISFTLAGVGSLSNALGVFGIGQGATGVRRY